MPGGNRKGPVGNGPMTGKQAGFCQGAAKPGSWNRFGFRGNRGGRGGTGWGPGQRRGWGYNPADMKNDLSEPAAVGEENEMLRQEVQNLETSLEKMKKRLSQLEKNDKG